MTRLLLTWMLMSVSALSLAVDIHLLPRAVVEGKSYRLADIATVSGQSANRFRDIEIGKSPRPGAKLHLGIDQIKSRLYQVVPELVSSIQWMGASAINVTATGKKLNVDRVIAMADTELVRWSEMRNLIEYDFALIDKPDPILLPQFGELNITAKVSKQTDKALARMPIWVDVWVDEEHYHSYHLWYRFNARQSVYVATSTLSKYTRLTGDMLQKEIVDITALKGKPITALVELDNKRLRFDVSAGEALSFEGLEIAPLVSKGETVIVDIQLGGVGIKTKAVALNNGHFQEKISVLNPVTNSSYFATVVDQRKVKVE